MPANSCSARFAAHRTAGLARLQPHRHSSTSPRLPAALACVQVCNCDCLPIIPLDLGRCPTCAEEATKPGSPGQQACRMQQCQHPQQLAQRQLQHTFSGASSQHSDDEMMSGISRESMDSMRSEQFNNAAAGLAAAAPLPHF